MDITFIILTKNEEINIRNCLNSIQGFAKRIIVVDSGSDDNTTNIAKEMGAEVYIHQFENYAKQFNWALDNMNITTKWTFRLDADERLTPVLCEELEGLASLHLNDDINGIVIESWLYFLGKKIRYGCHNKRKIMMFKTGIGRIEDRQIDEHTVLNSGKVVLAKNRFIHYDFKDLTCWINKMNWYATREVDDYFNFKAKQPFHLEGNDKITSNIRKMKFRFYYRLPMFFRCWLLFVYNYIFKFGFLDGREGYIYNYMYHRWYRMLVDAKIYERLMNNSSKSKK